MPMEKNAVLWRSPAAGIPSVRPEALGSMPRLAGGQGNSQKGSAGGVHERTSREKYVIAVPGGWSRDCSRASINVLCEPGNFVKQSRGETGNVLRKKPVIYAGSPHGLLIRAVRGMAPLKVEGSHHLKSSADTLVGHCPGDHDTVKERGMTNRSSGGLP